MRKKCKHRMSEDGDVFAIEVCVRCNRLKFNTHGMLFVILKSYGIILK